MNYKRLALVSSLGLNIFLGAWLGHGAYTKYSGKGSTMGVTGLSSRSVIKKPRIFRIACLTPSSAQGPLNVINGFEETMKEYGLGEVQMRTYDSNGNRTLMRSHIEDILESNYDLVFSLGTECTKNLRELCVKRKVNVPVVFAGVKDPVGLEIVTSEKSSGNNFTGVSADHNMRLQMALLRVVKKDLKNVLVVYDPTQLGGYTAQMKREVEMILGEHKINVKSVEIYNVNEVAAKVSSAVPGADLVLTLRDHTALSAMEVLSKICMKHNVTLFASDLGSLEKGAAMAFGFRDRDSGIVAAQKARMILEDGKQPTEVPVTDVGERYKLRLNTKLMSKQNLKIDNNLFFLMEHGEVI